MTPQAFIKKWQKANLTERAAAQSHFIDLCHLVNHPTPSEADPEGSTFAFERGAAKATGGDGWADVWKKGFFGWEYKGKHKSLVKAYDQLLRYKDALENPPLLVTCDLDVIEIHTNFTNTAHRLIKIDLENLDTPESLKTLRAVFENPDALRPGESRQQITEKAARKIGETAKAMRDRGLDAEKVARFLDRLVFALFAEDVDLLPDKLLTKVLASAKQDPALFNDRIGELFARMATGGYFGIERIRCFNGGLFNDESPLELTPGEIKDLLTAAELDWSAVDPSVFGTLFERGLDPNTRAQLGAHYTGYEDILTLVEPVVMRPLRAEWDRTRSDVLELLQKATKPRLQKARDLAHVYLKRLWSVRVLDPACGSGNFLYVTLRLLKDLEKEVLDFAVQRDLQLFPEGEVGPWQLFGIELNPYALELAQTSVWIGYLQWRKEHGYGDFSEPILRKTDHFRLMDAILTETGEIPDWPETDFIVGNPPFLGGKLLRRELGDPYVNRLFQTYKGEVPAEADLCCYWFARAQRQATDGKVARVGLLATQGIRGGANRRVLESITKTGRIFFAVSDRDWVLDGANVHISMVGFTPSPQSRLDSVAAGCSVSALTGNADETAILDVREVPLINANLTSGLNLLEASPLRTNGRIAFQGPVKVGSFEVPLSIAVRMLQGPNPNGRPTSDVLMPWWNGLDVVRRPREYWIINFANRSLCDASHYESPMEHVIRYVKPHRLDNNDRQRRERWWLLGRSGSEWLEASRILARVIFTVRVAKFRLFVWAPSPVLPDTACVAFAADDDYTFGVLHSRFHETWALAMGTQLEDRPRYTSTTCFETFPFPEPTDAQRREIAAAAAELNRLRETWLNPDEWVQEQILEFPGSTDGPWARYLHDPNEKGIGTVRYPRLVPRNDAAKAFLTERTLTKLYNKNPEWLRLAHRRLDEAVAAAYGWPADLPNEQILSRLLALNLSTPANP